MVLNPWCHKKLYITEMTKHACSNKYKHGLDDNFVFEYAEKSEEKRIRAKMRVKKKQAKN